MLDHISWKKDFGLEGSILNSLKMKEINTVFLKAVSTIMKVSDTKNVRFFFFYRAQICYLIGAMCITLIWTGWKLLIMGFRLPAQK